MEASIHLGGTDGIENEFVGSVSNNIILQPQNYLNSVDSGSESFHDQESSVSDGESGTTGGNNERFQMFGNGLIKVDEEERLYKLIKQRFISGMGCLGARTTVVAIHRNSCSTVFGQARLQTFLLHSQATLKKRGGNVNIKHAWYGTSRDGIEKIISHGFGKLENNGLHGYGVYLSPGDSPLLSAKSLDVDEDGLRHLLLCRVVMGNVEVVHPGSDQSHPSSEEFDSGVDNLSSPKRFIVWSTHMNSHILPECVISFRAPRCLKGTIEIQDSLRKPTSPWMLFSTLFSVLSRFLPQNTINLIAKHHGDYKEKKISRQELIQRIRRITGDKLLIAVIKSFKDKQEKVSRGLTPSNSSK